jgi:hypothetical protein
VFFPWRVLIVLAVMGTILGVAAGTLINPNAGYVVFITMIGHYMVYETFHFCCHVPRTGSCATCRSSTPFAATTARTTTWGS